MIAKQTNIVNNGSNMPQHHQGGWPRVWVQGRTPFYAVSVNCLTNPDDTP